VMKSTTLRMIPPTIPPTTTFLMFMAIDTPRLEKSNLLERVYIEYRQGCRAMFSCRVRQRREAEKVPQNLIRLVPA
jgi:hypothetical protein